MKILKGRFLRALLTKWIKLSPEVLTSATYEYWQWKLLNCAQKEPAIPRDVPKGHMVVYVGEERKRFVIKVAFLEHPLFHALLEQAHEEYEFNPHAKLCIPCDEHIFRNILHHVGSRQHQRLWLCF